MVAVTISISEEQLAFAKAQAAERGFAGIEAYIESLISERLREDGPDEDFGAPSKVRVNSLGGLRAKIEEGLTSPVREMTRADFDRMRDELVAQRSNLRKG